MKKSLVLTIILVSMVVLACDVNIATRDITVVNNCDWEIQASITASPSLSPNDPSYILVTPGSARTFKGLEMGDYYLYVIPTDPSNPIGSNEMTVDKYDTWVVTWDETEYKVSYTR